MRQTVVGEYPEFGRERALANAIQLALERLYQVDRVVEIGPFIYPASDGAREILIVHEASPDEFHLQLQLPFLGSGCFDVLADNDLDPLCQLIEGVSHFVHLTNRASTERRTTHLELELQAEVDKYLILLAGLRSQDLQTSFLLRERLYRRVNFAGNLTDEEAERYKLANRLAERLTERLERRYLIQNRLTEMRAELRYFFRSGQEEKIRMSLAA